MPPVRDVAKSNLDSSNGELVFAVDTGGTKTAAWLVESLDSEAHRLLGQARTSAGNPLSVGFERATQVIDEALTLARRQSQVGDKRVSRALLSIAGAANRDMTARFVAWAHEIGLADRIAIVSDVLPILAAGTPDCCGIALISGTGSCAFGRAADGRSKRCGGWGFLLGDEGSGYAIGRAVLQLALVSFEEGKPRPLAEAVHTKLGVKSVTELTRAIYGNPDPRHTVAALAPLVATAAESGDTDAEVILTAAAADLAKLVTRTASAVGLSSSGIPLAVSGGLLINSKRLQEKLQLELTSRGLDSALNVVREPLAGCVRLAQPRFADVLVKWHVT
jgi:N-acetylglucosamine kinase-like BadF-type ATPase